MSTKIFVNLTIKDLKKSMDFFTKLGYTFNKQFTDDKAACLVVSDTIYAMLVTQPFFKQLTKTSTDWQKENGSECTMAISLDNKEAVNAWAEKALAAGATENIVPEMQQGDSMYGRSI